MNVDLAPQLATGRRGPTTRAGESDESCDQRNAASADPVRHPEQSQDRLNVRLSRQSERLEEVKRKHAQRLDRQDERIKTLAAQLKMVNTRLAGLGAAEEGLREFDELWGHLGRYVEPPPPQRDAALELRVQRARAAVNRRTEAMDRLLEAVCEQESIHLRDASLRFIDRKALATLVRDILVEEQYFFDHPGSSPRVIDAGSSFGMAIYYFKHLYPEARILGFEPAEDVFEMLQHNIERNGWRDVQVLPCALAGTDGPRPFYRTREDRLADSLTRRKRHLGDELVECEVPCQRLSPFLDEPVDLLKLDIEGAEREVLPEIRAHLPRVRHLVCEFHMDPAMRPEHLGRTIDLLERSDFHVHATRTGGFGGRVMPRRPMNAVEKPQSLVIWAKNRRPVAGAGATRATPNGSVNAR